MQVTQQDIAVIVTNIFGFLIVLWVLRKFAWGPLMQFLEDRRRRIADEFATIDRDKSQAGRLRGEYEEKLKEIEAVKRARIQEGVSEAQQIAETIKAESRRVADEIRDRARDSAQRELDKARIELRDEIVEMTIRSTEKIIQERLDDAKHRELIAKTIDGVGKA